MPLFFAGTARDWRVWLLRVVVGAVVFAALILTVIAGLKLRRWAWDITAPARFVPDMQRNFLYGNRAINEGYLNIYENVYADREPGDYDIDYPPLRLLTFELWIADLKRDQPDLAHWESSYEFNAPLLNFNTFMEVASAVAAFLIVRRWTRTQKPWMADWQSWLRAAVAAALIWFSPGGLADGHGWASYDVWIPPFFLWAILLTSYGWWTSAGMVLGIGAMFKGQMLLVAPFFFVWPVVAGKPKQALRVLVGFTIATAAVASPFILSSEIERTGSRQIHWAAIGWIICVAVAAVVVWMTELAVLDALPTNRRRFAIGGAIALAVAMILWPLMGAGNRGRWPMLMLIGGAGLYLAATWLVNRRWRALVPLAGAAAAIFAGMAFFDNSPAWWSVGYRYGAEKFYTLVAGPNANLPALLQDRYQWRSLTETAMTIPAHIAWHWPDSPLDVTTRQFLLALYFIALASCTVIAGIHWRRGDRRFLVAASTLWLMFYCLLPQMIGRYLLFGSTVGAIAVAECLSLGFLVFFLSMVTAICTIQCMCLATSYTWAGQPNVITWQQFYAYLQATTPDIGWAVLLSTGVFLYISIRTPGSPKVTPPAMN
jgi:hypothetical protein